VPRQPTTWLQVSGYRFLLRRVECALLRRDADTPDGRLLAHTAALKTGCAVAAIAVAGCAVLGLLRPKVPLDRAQIVMGQESGALYVRVGDTWHPVLNLASARLIAATAANPQPVPESDLSRAKRGPLMGIPGAPQVVGKPLSVAESVWTICDTGDAGATTIIVGRTDGASARPLAAGEAVLVTPAPGSPAYLLYNGQRAVVDLADAAIVRALRLEGRAPRHLSHTLLNAAPEAPPITSPRIRHLGDKASAVPGFPVGSVLRIARADGDEYYAVLAAGVQRIGQVAADILRFSNSQGTANTVPAAPDTIRAAPTVNELPVSGFPDRPPTLPDAGSALCVTWQPAQSGPADLAFLVGSGPPVPAGQAAVTLAQADGPGPALDGVYLAPGRGAYVQPDGAVGTRYLVTDSGVRFAVRDDDAAHDLGLGAANPAPWPILAALPGGPELSRAKASIARDTVAGSP